jgi:galactose mutarotase-like enzyme
MVKSYTLLSPDKRSIIEISNQGAQILSYKKNNKKILHEDSFNHRRSGIPILFPFAGPLKDNILTLTNTKLTQHGFGRDVIWQVYQIQEKDDFNIISFALSNADLPEIWQNNYPFPFITMVHYYLSNNSLDIDLVVMNPLQEDLQIPVKPGFHPYFEISHKDKAKIKVSKGQTLVNKVDWDSDFAAIFIDNNESKYHFELNDIKFKTTTKHRLFKLSDETKDISLDLNEKIVIWSQPQMDFVCIEPISGPFNSINYNPILIQKGQGYQFRYKIEFSFNI